MDARYKMRKRMICQLRLEEEKDKFMTNQQTTDF